MTSSGRNSLNWFYENYIFQCAYLLVPLYFADLESICNSFFSYRDFLCCYFICIYGEKYNKRILKIKILLILTYWWNYVMLPFCWYCYRNTCISNLLTKHSTCFSIIFTFTIRLYINPSWFKQHIFGSGVYLLASH